MNKNCFMLMVHLRIYYYIFNLVLFIQVRHVGGGNRSIRTDLSSRMSSCISQDDLDDDTRSVATSSHVSVARSQVASLARSSPQSVARKTIKTLSRQSSKESSTSESDDVPPPPAMMVQKAKV